MAASRSFESARACARRQPGHHLLEGRLQLTNLVIAGLDLARGQIAVRHGLRSACHSCQGRQKALHVERDDDAHRKGQRG